MRKVYTTRKTAFFLEESRGRTVVTKLWEDRYGVIYSKRFEMNPITRKIWSISGSQRENNEDRWEDLLEALREGRLVEQRTIYGELDSEESPRPPEDAIFWWDTSDVGPGTWYRPAITYIRAKDKDEKELRNKDEKGGQR